MSRSCATTTGRRAGRSGPTSAPVFAAFFGITLTCAVHAEIAKRTSVSNALRKSQIRLADPRAGAAQLVAVRVGEERNFIPNHTTAHARGAASCASGAARRLPARGLRSSPAVSATVADEVRVAAFIAAAAGLIERRRLEIPPRAARHATSGDGGVGGVAAGEKPRLEKAPPVPIREIPIKTNGAARTRTPTAAAADPARAVGGHAGVVHPGQDRGPKVAWRCYGSLVRRSGTGGSTGLLFCEEGRMAASRSSRGASGRRARRATGRALRAAAARARGRLALPRPNSPAVLVPPAARTCAPPPSAR